MSNSLVRLNCWIWGDSPYHTFAVEIETAKTVGDLKHAIKTQDLALLRNHAAPDLTLIHVSKSVDDLYASETNPERLDIDLSRPLRPTSRLSSIFRENNVKDDYLQIVVQAPVTSLNCLVLGDDLKDAFTVKIDKNDNVSTLKCTIKEEKTVMLRNIEASQLCLFAVSIYADDDLGEKVQQATASREPLGPPLLPLSEVFPGVEKGHLHVIVQVPTDGELI
ncbi:hypothetical protein CPB84DRAFT_1673505 [Gymnopilus junonius]|uniref:Crinkler effector protein N-terminal domain-containing protein n=1 Tax=Gymnopilus junonius TaxID=109634 RepID=A0A9P5NYX7_GYMJU|nr:hypothetical protein CPB84DRAFT_1673505 [Gymnopilus junonius]